MTYVFSLAIVITGIAVTGLRALFDMMATSMYAFDIRSLLIILAAGLLLRHQWARLTAMTLSVVASLSMFYIGIRGTLSASNLHVQAFWYDSTNASVVVLWVICSVMIGYFFWSYRLLASKRAQRYFTD